MILYTLTTCQVYLVSPPLLIKIWLSTTWKNMYDLKKFVRKDMSAEVEN